MVNLELYKIFLVVADMGNITKASEVLNISQPAVTKHIKNLEEQLGNPLFIRTKKGVVLNEYGEKIYLNVKNALNIFNDIEKEMNVYKDQNIGTIKIGISTTLAKKIVLKHFESFNKKYPNIKIIIDTDPTKELIKKLKLGKIDIIISKFPSVTDMDLEYNLLGKTKYIFAVGEKYKDLKNKELFLNELKDYPFLVQSAPSNSNKSFNDYLIKNNVKIDPAMNIASSNLLADFIELGYGIGYVTKLYVEEQLKAKRIYELNVIPDTPKIEYGIILLKNNMLTSHCKLFVDYIIQKFSDSF